MHKWRVKEEDYGENKKYQEEHGGDE